MTQHRKLLIGGVALLVLAGVLFGTLRVLYGPRSAYVHVRWAPTVDQATQARIEREHSLMPVEFREQRTWSYYLTDVSTDNIRGLVREPAVEDTHYIDRAKFRIVRDATRGDYTTGRPGWIADMIEFGIDGSLVAGAIALAAGAFTAWRDRRDRSRSAAA